MDLGCGVASAALGFDVVSTSKDFKVAGLGRAAIAFSWDASTAASILSQIRMVAPVGDTLARCFGVHRIVHVVALKKARAQRKREI